MVDENQAKANDLIKKANAAWSNQKWSEAAMWYERAALLYKPYRTFYIVAGECYIKLQDFEGAEEILQRLLDFSPEHEQAWWMVGQAILFQNRFEDAEEYFDKSIELGATDIEPYYYGAMVKVLLDKKDAVLPLLRQALKIRPDWEKYMREDRLLCDYIDLL